MFTSFIVLLASFTNTFEFSKQESNSNEWVYEESDGNPFDELIVSWNGFRPSVGKWVFWIRLKQKDWSPWLRYAEWTADSQKTFKSSPEGSWAESYQDAAYPKNGFCHGFQIKITAEDGANLGTLESLFACASNLKKFQISTPGPLSTIQLRNVDGQSQMVLDHPRSRDLCSPTSTSTAVNYLLGYRLVSPTIFASKVRDVEFDIYGNWILNTAEAYEELKGSYKVHVQRLNGFQDLHSYLMQGIPVVVSLKGPLPGGALPYSSGHLLCVVGYDAEESKVYCIDSAFPSNDATRVSYSLTDFLEAWGRRKNLSYVFPKR